MALYMASPIPVTILRVHHLIGISCVDFKMGKILKWCLFSTPTENSTFALVGLLLCQLQLIRSWLRRPSYRSMEKTRSIPFLNFEALSQYP